MKTDAPGFPFVAIAGLDLARRALLCTALDPQLKGALLTGGVGNGKSLLVQSFADFRARSLDPQLSIRRVPVGAPADALRGSVDLVASLAAGRRIERAGLLDRSGLFVVEDLELVDPVARWLLKTRIESGPGYGLLATAGAPCAGQLALPDWIPLLIELPARLPSPGAEVLLARRTAFEGAPAAWSRSWRKDEARLAAQIREARTRVGRTQVTAEAWHAIHGCAARLGVPGGRAPCFAVRVARAHAAWHEAPATREEDVAFAVTTVLEPRASGPARSGRSRQRGGEEEPVAEPSRADAGPAVVLPPDPARVAALAPLPPTATARTGASRGRCRAPSSQRGRPVRALPARGRGGRVALTSTLLRAVQRAVADPADGPVRVRVRAADLMVHEFEEPTGTLYLLAVDTSGSMAQNRMREAKGLAIGLLRDAYRHRDAIALVGFAGERAELLVPPTGSIARARQCIEVVPTGGGTPLASALQMLAGLAQRERRGSGRAVHCAILTDGRANVALAGSGEPVGGMAVMAELERVARAYAALQLPTLVVDTRPPWDSRQDARRVADLLEAGYTRLATPSS